MGLGNAETCVKIWTVFYFSYNIYIFKLTTNTDETTPLPPEISLFGTPSLLPPPQKSHWSRLQTLLPPHTRPQTNGTITQTNRLLTVLGTDTALTSDHSKILPSCFRLPPSTVCPVSGSPDHIRRSSRLHTLHSPYRRRFRT